MHPKDTQIPSYQLSFTSLTVTKDSEFYKRQNIAISVSFPYTKMDSVLVHCHWTEMTCHFLTEPELHSHTGCPSQHHHLHSCQRTPFTYSPKEKCVESPSDITDLPAFCECSISTDIHGMHFIDKRDREQLPFNITVLRKHYLNRKGNGQSQQTTRLQSTDPWEREISKKNGKEALNFKCKKLFT